MVIAALVDRHHAPSWVRLGLVVGLLGGYTTFSTFAQGGLDLLREGRPAIAVVYTGASVCGGILAVYAGTLMGRTL